MSRCDRVEMFTAGSWVHVDQRPLHYWSYIASNGRILADGAQGYSRRADALKGVQRVTGLTLASTPDFTQDIEGQERQVWEVKR